MAIAEWSASAKSQAPRVGSTPAYALATIAAATDGDRRVERIALAQAPRVGSTPAYALATIAATTSRLTDRPSAIP